MSQTQKLVSAFKRARPRLGWLRGTGSYLFLAPAVIFVGLAMLYPLGYTLYLSMRDVTVGNFMAGTAPFVGLDNYAEVIANPTFRRSLFISLTFTAGSIVFQFILGFALALFFNRSFPGSGTMRAFMLLGWMLPIVVSGNIWRWMLDGGNGVVNFVLQGLGLLDGPRFWLTDPGTALIGTIIANIWVGIPFNMILLLAGLQGISLSLYEAADIDGANAWQRFLWITLPLMRPVALIVLLLGFIYTFRVFDLIFVMTGGGPVDATTTLPIYVYDQTFEFFRFGEGAAAASLLLVISLGVSAFYLWLSRHEEAA